MQPTVTILPIFHNIEYDSTTSYVNKNVLAVPTPQKGNDSI